MNSLVRLSLQASPEVLTILEETLPELGYAVARWEEAETGASRLDLFFNHPAEAESAEPHLRALLANLAPTTPCSIERRELPPEDWAESWKRFFKPEQVSPRLRIRPSWEPASAADPDVRDIIVDPGLCFGTGRHPTTRACLRFLDEAARRHRIHAPLSFLDVGCGSGILAIAAARLGYQPVAGFDVDAEAVACARDNARRNEVENQIVFTVHDLRTYTPEFQVHVVAANLETPLLLGEASRLAAWPEPSPRGALLLAGIPSREWSQVADVYASLGFVEVARNTEDGWTSGWLARRP